MSDDNCADLERKAIEAARDYDLAAKQAVGTKVESKFYTIVFNEKNLANLDTAKANWEKAIDEWVTKCLSKKN